MRRGPIWRMVVGLVAVAALLGCDSPAGPPRTIRPQSVVLFVTPKIIADFAAPQASVAQFLEHYQPLTSRALETIVIFAVGNSEHILTYRGTTAWTDSIDWARYTDGIRDSDRQLDYGQVAGIVQEFKNQAAALGMQLKVFDQVDQGIEFTHEFFKLNRHHECFSDEWESFDIGGVLLADDFEYATAPAGIVAGKNCGHFLADQVGRYVLDLGFDGILYGNQLGTRGRWLPENGPGYTAAEAARIADFFAYSKTALVGRELMWFDSYNNTDVERASWSVPTDAYGHFDYIIASGFCVITFPARYVDNLRSKLRIKNRPRVLATLDYVDPWYTYNSMTSFPGESANLETVATNHRDQIDGLVFFANDDDGSLVPRLTIESFATRFFTVP